MTKTNIEQTVIELQQALDAAGVSANVGGGGMQVAILMDSENARELSRCLLALEDALELLSEAIAGLRTPSTVEPPDVEWPAAVGDWLEWRVTELGEKQ